MQFKRILPNSFVVRFRQGEDVVQGLLFFAKKIQLKSAWISGLGGFEEATLGFYDAKKKIYPKKSFKRVELTSLAGNLCKTGKEYVLHTHANISDSKFKVYGGHLFTGKISATCEVFITEIKKIERVLDKKVGLELMRLK